MKDMLGRDASGGRVRGWGWQVPKPSISFAMKRLQEGRSSFFVDFIFLPRKIHQKSPMHAEHLLGCTGGAMSRRARVQRQSHAGVELRVTGASRNTGWEQDRQGIGDETNL